MGFKGQGVITSGLPMHIIDVFFDNISINWFVELGTASGDSIKEAAKHFKQCYTIELNPSRQIADKSLKNISWLTGNSVDVLPIIIDILIENKGDSKEHEYCLFWIDSHFDGDKPKDSPYKDCYLMEELEILAGDYREDSIILIDDARLFYGNPPQPNTASEWPAVQDIFIFLKDKFPYHFATIVDDYILCLPDRIKWVFDKMWMGQYNIRYPSDAEKLRSQTKDVFNAFTQYIK